LLASASPFVGSSPHFGAVF